MKKIKKKVLGIENMFIFAASNVRKMTQGICGNASLIVK